MIDLSQKNAYNRIIYYNSCTFVDNKKFNILKNPIYLRRLKKNKTTMSSDNQL